MNRLLTARLLSFLKQGDPPAGMETARLFGWRRRVEAQPAFTELSAALLAESQEETARAWREICAALQSDYVFRHGLALLFGEWAREERGRENWERALLFWRESLSRWAHLWGEAEFWEMALRGRDVDAERWKAFQRDFPMRLLMRPYIGLEQALRQGRVAEAAFERRCFAEARAACEAWGGEAGEAAGASLDAALEGFVSKLLEEANLLLEADATEPPLQKNYAPAVAFAEQALEALPGNLRLLSFLVEQCNDWAYDEYEAERYTLFRGVMQRATPHIESLRAQTEEGRDDLAQNRIVAAALTRRGFSAPTEEAIGCYRAALRYEPDSENALTLLFGALLRRADQSLKVAPAEAFDSLQEAYRLWDSHGRALGDSAGAESLAEGFRACGAELLSRQSIDVAALCMRTLCEMQPENGVAQATLAHIERLRAAKRRESLYKEAEGAIATGELERAETLLWEIMREERFSLAARRLLATVQKRLGLRSLERGERGEARRLLELAQSLNPDDSSIEFALEIAARYTGDAE